MDGLKLDKHLIDNMWTAQGKIILNALVQTGHSMELTILAEGVEDDKQIEILQSLNCDVLKDFDFCPHAGVKCNGKDSRSATTSIKDEI